jgi:hypothetical protein
MAPVKFTSFARTELYLQLIIEDVMGMAHAERMGETRNAHTKFWSEHLNGRDHSKDLPALVGGEWSASRPDRFTAR